MNIQQPGQSYSYEPAGYASSSLAAAPSAGYAQSELGQPQYALQGILSLIHSPYKQSAKLCYLSSSNVGPL